MPSTLKHSLHKDSLKVLEVYMQALTTVFQDEAALFLEKKITQLRVKFRKSITQNRFL